MKNKAFTLIETLIAITLMTVVITAVTGLILSTLMANSSNKRNLQATLLAQESLEALRYMRDSNWLQNYDWDGGTWGVDFEASSTVKTIYLIETSCSTTLSSHPCFELSSNPDDIEVELEDGSIFNRSLELLAVGTSTGSPSTEETEVTAVVTWTDRGVEHSVELSTYLTNWK